MREVLKLVGTKWNIGTYQPSFGTGGYCIPLSSEYVMEGAEHPEELTILKSTIKTDHGMPLRVAKKLKKAGCKNVGILGLSYRGNLKVHILSPAIRIAEHLKKMKIKVKAYDPYYSDAEMERLLGVETFDFPDGLTEFDALLVVADHKEFVAAHVHQRLWSLKKCKIILDNTAIWKDIDFASKGIEYHVAGDEKWLA